MSYHDIEQGVCPVCGAQLAYKSDIKRAKGEQNACFETACPSCGWEGEEYYYLEFQGYMTYSEGHDQDEFLL